MLLSAVFEAAKSKRWNYCRTNPCRDINDEFKPGKSAARTRRFIGDEETHLLAALDSISRNNDIPLVVRFALATAARQSEIIGKPATSTRKASPGLCWEDVNFEMRSAILRDTKNGLDRLVPLGTAALVLLSALPRPIYGGKVFNVKQDGLIRAMAAACKAADIDDFTFHDLRHEATSRMSEQGIQSSQIQKVTGHSGAEMLARYTHVDTLKLAQRLS
jgi:hypothetical protein